MRLRLYGTQLQLGAQPGDYAPTDDLQRLPGAGGEGSFTGEPQFTLNTVLLMPPTTFSLNDPVDAGPLLISLLLRLPEPAASPSRLLNAGELELGVIGSELTVNGAATGATIGSAFTHLILTHSGVSTQLYLGGTLASQVSVPVNHAGLIVLAPQVTLEVALLTAYQTAPTISTVLHLQREVSYRAQALGLPMRSP